MSLLATLLGDLLTGRDLLALHGVAFERHDRLLERLHAALFLFGGIDLVVFFEQHLARFDLTALELFRHGGDVVERERYGEHFVGDLQLTGFDLLGDRDLLLAREERHAAHLLEVHPNRIGSVAEGALLGLGRLGLRLGRLRLGFSLRGEAFLLHRLDDLDVHVAEHRHHAVELFGCRAFARDRLVDFRVGEVASLLTEIDQLADLFRVLLAIARRGRRSRGLRGGMLLGARGRGGATGGSMFRHQSLP